MTMRRGPIGPVTPQCKRIEKPLPMPVEHFVNATNLWHDGISLLCPFASQINLANARSHSNSLQHCISPKLQHENHGILVSATIKVS
jgi:hypothetical protein